MPGRRYIRPCPQHEAGATSSRPAYLHRNCIECMAWLAKHPEDAALCRQSVPGNGAYSRKGSGRGWHPRMQIASERRRKETA
jgi:hypothetical protein